VNDLPPAPDSENPTDSLELFEEVGRFLVDLYQKWDITAPVEDDNPRHAVWAAREHGSIGKEILEQAALRLAAIDDLAAVLRTANRSSLADELGRNSPYASRLADHLAELSRGVSAIDLRYSEEFSQTIERLRVLWDDELRDNGRIQTRLRSALQGRRSLLRSATFVRGHAPIHPATRRRWYHGIPVIVRIHALYDRMAGFPGAESTPTSDVRLSRQYDPER
jgi:hypothetical protein